MVWTDAAGEWQAEPFGTYSYLVLENSDFLYAIGVTTAMTTARIGYLEPSPSGAVCELFIYTPQGHGILRVIFSSLQSTLAVELQRLCYMLGT